MTEEEKYAAEDRAHLRKEQILEYIQRCEACSECMIVQKRASGGLTRRIRNKIKTLDDISRWMHITDFQCVSTRSVMDEMRRQGF